MNALITFGFFILIIGFLVFIHELGHFAAAKLQGIPVKQFAIGFGPVLLKKKFKETTYQIRIFPLGGFVDLEGEHDANNPKGFRNRRFLPKTIVLVAGVVMNLLAAIVLLFINLNRNDYYFFIPDLSDYEFTNAEYQTSAFPITITEVVEGGNSDGQLVRGDNIISIDGERFESQKRFTELLKENEGKIVKFEFIDFETFDITEREIALGEADEEGRILQAYYIYDNETNKPTYFVKYEDGIVSAFAHTYDMSIYQFKALYALISESVSEGDYEEASKAVGSPIAVAYSVKTVVDYQVYEALFFLTGLISLSLAIFNILPIPALDGGQIVVAAVESIRRKKLSDELLEKINAAGFIILISFSLLIILKDIWQYEILKDSIDLIESAFGK